MGLDRLRAAAAVVGGEDLSAVPAVELGDRVVELRAIIDGLEGVWSRLVAAFDGSGAVEVEAGTAAWLRSACRLSPAVARSRVVLARRLAQRPAVDAALTAGAISVDHARLVTRALDELADAAGPELAAAAEPPLVAAARRCDPARLRREIAHARHALVPEAAAAADEQVHQRRYLDLAATLDGTVVVTGVLDPEGGETLLTALAPLSTPAGPDDPRTAGQRRADALVDLCRHALDAGALPAVGGERPHVTVLVPLPTLTHRPSTDAGAGAGSGSGDAGSTPHAHCTDGGLDLDPGGALGRDRLNQPGAGVSPPGIRRGDRLAASSWAGAETTWGAVLGSEAARRLGCDAAITRVVLDPDSQPLDVGRRTRLIPPAIRTALAVRDRGCVFPGCDRPPPWTDAHHVMHWTDGGPTALDNLILLCRRHHRTVHEGHWHITRGPTGRWTIRPGPTRPRAA